MVHVWDGESNRNWGISIKRSWTNQGIVGELKMSDLCEKYERGWGRRNNQEEGGADAKRTQKKKPPNGMGVPIKFL